MIKYYLQIYRALILCGIAASLFWYRSHESARGEQPVTLKEVRAHLPDAKRLIFDNDGVQVLDESDNFLGRALRTAPHANHIKGYAGSTDALIIIDDKQKIIGVSLRSSNDTPGHAEDVQGDYTYLENWQGRILSEISQIKDLEEHEVWGVSGATKTSDCMSEGIIFRSGVYLNQQQAPMMKWKIEDLIFIVVLVLALLGTFTRIKKVPKYRKILRLLIFLIVVFKGIDLLCLSILSGWAINGVPWHSAPVLLGYMTLFFLIPLTTRKQIYCQQVCPHGFIQECLEHLLPKKYHWKLSKDSKWLLSFIPFLLILSAIIISLFDLPWDLSDLEVFAAWCPNKASLICLGLFVVSIIISIFIPKGYCKYACPTGRLLDYARSKGKSDKFSNSDKAAGGIFIITLLTVVFLMYFKAGGGE